jgi:hypothetical protein
MISDLGHSFVCPPPCLITLTALLVFGEGIFATPQPTQSQSDEERNTLIYVPNESGGITEINSAGNVVFGTAPWSWRSSRYTQGVRSSRAFWFPLAHSASNSVTSWVSDIALRLNTLNFARARSIHQSRNRASGSMNYCLQKNLEGHDRFRPRFAHV